MNLPRVAKEVEEEVLAALLAADEVGADAVEVLVDAQARFLRGSDLHSHPLRLLS